MCMCVNEINTIQNLTLLICSLIIPIKIPDETYKNELLSKYVFHLPSSTLGIYQNAAVAVDASPCAKIARYTQIFLISFKM